MADELQPPTREQISEIVNGDSRLIRAFERLFQIGQTDLPDLEQELAEAVMEAGTAMAAAQTSAAISSMVKDLAALAAHAPVYQELPTNPTFNELFLKQDLIMPKTSGVGIKLDPGDPTFGWHDLKGKLDTRGPGGGGSASIPSYADYGGSGIYAYQFSNAKMNEVFIEYHIPHDYLPGSDMYIHTHWSQTTVDTGGPAGVPGNARWYFDISYATGHGTAGGAADPFNVTPTTVNVIQQGSTTQYGHMIAEVQFSNGTGSGGLIDRDRFEVDGLLLVRMYRDPADASDTLDVAPFVHMVDIHYQSTNVATKNRAPDFYT